MWKTWQLITILIFSHVWSVGGLYLASEIFNLEDKSDNICDIIDFLIVVGIVIICGPWVWVIALLSVGEFIITYVRDFIKRQYDRYLIRRTRQSIIEPTEPEVKKDVPNNCYECKSRHCNKCPKN